MSLSATDKDDIRTIFNEGFETLILPQFERLDGRMDGLENRMDGLENRMDGLGGRMDGLENRMDGLGGRMDSLAAELHSFKEEVYAKLTRLEEKVDALEHSHTDRFENVEDDIRLIYRLIEKLEHGNKEEQVFAEQTIIAHLPAIYKAVVLLAKKQHITLPDA